MKKSSKRKCVVLEGLPAAGKTSLANYLRDRHGFYKVNESLGYLGGVNATNDQRLIFRETLAKYHRSKQHALSIIDRGYPSMLAWDYCTSKRRWAHDFVEKKRWVQEALKQNKLFEPSLYVYIQISPLNSLLRRPRNANRLDVWSDKEGMLYCQEFYAKFFDQSAIAEHTLVVGNDVSVRATAQKILKALND